MNTKGLAIVIIGLISCGTPTAAVSQEQFNPVTRAYAKAYGLSVEEAKLRLSQESEITQLQSTLESSEPAYASLRVIHRPEFKIEVLATGDAQALLRRHTKSPDFVAKSVPRSMADLKGAQAAAARVLTNLRAEFETDYDADSGEVNFYVLNDTQARPALDSIIKNSRS